jgi:hypothetical protein
MFSIWVRRLAPLAILAFTAAAAAKPQPALPPDGEVSFDGLHRVENARFQGVWIRKGTDFSVFKKLLILPSEIAYKSPPTRNRMARDNFELDERQMKRLRELARDVFRDELVEEGGWEVTETPGPDVLLVKGGLLDLVVHVPPNRAMGARGGTWVSSYGEMTLVIQFYDSQTREILARVAERREAEPPGGYEFSKVETSATADMRMFFRRWAKRLREGLDAVREHKP